MAQLAVAAAEAFSIANRALSAFFRPVFFRPIPVRSDEQHFRRTLCDTVSHLRLLSVFIVRLPDTI
jgi:hypothetical protein